MKSKSGKSNVSKSLKSQSSTSSMAEDGAWQQYTSSRPPPSSSTTATTTSSPLARRMKAAPASSAPAAAVAASGTFASRSIASGGPRTYPFTLAPAPQNRYLTRLPQSDGGGGGGGAAMMSTAATNLAPPLETPNRKITHRININRPPPGTPPASPDRQRVGCIAINGATNNASGHARPVNTHGRGGDGIAMVGGRAASYLEPQIVGADYEYGPLHPSSATDDAADAAVVNSSGGSSSTSSTNVAVIVSPVRFARTQRQIVSQCSCIWVHTCSICVEPVLH